MKEFLNPGRFVDSDHPEVVEFTLEAVHLEKPLEEQAVELYYAVRDQIAYTPYLDFADPNNYSASGVLGRNRGWCVAKSALLVAGARVLGIPARCGYADVANHLTSKKMRAAMGGSNVFYWHSYSELYLYGGWVKATPAFNRSLCDKVGIRPLEFDGRHDSLFHEFDRSGSRHMEYLQDRGVFADVPFRLIIKTFREKYSDTLLAVTSHGDFEEDVDI